jgi:hypothetical protein
MDLGHICSISNHKNWWNGLLFLRFCSIGSTKSHPNLSAKSAKLFLSEPATDLKRDNFSYFGSTAAGHIHELWKALFCPVRDYERKWPLDLINYIIFFHLFQIVSD